MIIGVDPGKQTGLAYAFGPLFVEPRYSHGALDAPAWEAMKWVHAELEKTHVDLVCCEGITITAKTAQKSQDVKISLEQIGCLRYLCMLYGVDFRVQPPSDKSFGSDTKLRALGWWTKGTDHARDASRHIIAALCSTDCSKYDAAWARDLAGRI